MNNIERIGEWHDGQNGSWRCCEGYIILNEIEKNGEAERLQYILRSKISSFGMRGLQYACTGAAPH